MSIDRLNKAASAAGFVMATPDDETAPEARHADEASTAPARAIVVAQPATGLLSSEAVSGITNWLKGHVPGLGGRQPA